MQKKTKKNRHARRQMSVKSTDMIQMYCNLGVCRAPMHPRGDVKPVEIISTSW